MNKLFLSLAFLFSVLVSKAQTRIDFDYTKVFSINSMWVDFNQNNIADEGEVYEFGAKGRCELYISHKDFDTSGNLMLFKFTLQGGDKKEVFRNSLDDVVFFKGDDMYSVRNKLNEQLFGVTYSNGKWFLLIFNPAILLR